ncbi:MAG: hypothetical protein K9M81_04470 [Chthoniobacterales bacterium]|nr:hypothetical protein [Chthoniobacterales bacterium]
MSIFFQKHPHIQAVIHQDTGGAVEEIKRGEDPSCAAIASSLAAKYYGLNVLKFHLEDDLENYTRFVLLSKKKSSSGLTRIFHTDSAAACEQLMDTASASNWSSGSVYTHSRRQTSSLALPHQPSRPPRHDQYEISGLTRIFHTDSAAACEHLTDTASVSNCSSGSMKHTAVVAIHHLPCLHQDSRRLATNQYEISGLMEKHHKCSISFNLEHRKGALVSVLEALSNQGVNLTKIESRPICGKAFEYLFYLDFQIPLETNTWNTQALLEDLQKRVKNLHLLGIYECC